MITDLTPEQEKMIPVYYKRYFNLGMDTSRIDRQKTLKCVGNVYKNSGFDPPKEVLFFESPLAALMHIVEAESIGHLTDEQKKRMRDELGQNYTWGSLSAYWVGFYAYLMENLPVKMDDNLKTKFENFREFSMGVFWWFPYKDICLISEKPIEIHRQNGALHRDGGPALCFSDGLASVWFLRGVRVPRELAETPADKLDPKLLATISNAEVRRELVHKAGAENLINKLPNELLDRMEYVPGQVANTLSDLTEQITAAGGYLDKELADELRERYEPILYELYRIQLGNDLSGTVLKMTNPSTRDTHIEWVDDACTTVKQANTWRRGGIEDEPAVLT